MDKPRVNIPQVADIVTALEIYYSKLTLTGEDIQTLFARPDGRRLSSATVAKLRQLAEADRVDREIPSRNPRHVNTDSAFKAWGLDVDEMERRFAHLKKIRK